MRYSYYIVFARLCMNLGIKKRIRFLGAVVTCILLAVTSASPEEVPETLTDELCVFTWRYDKWLEGEIPWNGETLYIYLMCNKNDSAAVEKRLADFHTLVARLPAREKEIRSYIIKEFGTEYSTESLNTLSFFSINIADGHIDYLFVGSTDLFPTDTLAIRENGEGVIEAARFIG